MKKEDCKWNVDWEVKSSFYPDSLTTSINHVSSMIHRSTLRGGGSDIIFHSKMLSTFEKMEYFNNETQTLCGRYTSHIDDTIEENVVYVYHKDVENIIAIPVAFHGKKEIDLNESYEFDSIEFRGVKEFSEEEIENHKKKLCGYVQVIGQIPE